MNAPLRCGEPIRAAEFAVIRRRAIFECCKWDPHVGDVASLSRIPLLLTGAAWSALVRSAEALAREIAAAETELLGRPELWRELAIPPAVRRALRRARTLGAPASIARVVRFDFHPTADGWRISEANTDVPGGFVEAQGFAQLVAERCPETSAIGEPASAYADAVRRVLPAGGLVALVHATAYADDRQVMVYVGRELERRGLRPVLVSPEHLRWIGGRAEFSCRFASGRPDAVLRFFPAEWLPQCSRASHWPSYFAGAVTPLGNPGTALLTQSKRLPLVWDRLAVPMDAWRALLPETRAPSAPDGDPGRDWVVKPALGRVGDGVGIAGVTPPRERELILKWRRRSPGDWVEQRRFDSVPLDSAEGPLHACLGVFTVDAKAVGVYGRVAREPLIDARAQDAAVLLTAPAPVAAEEVLA